MATARVLDTDFFINQGLPNKGMNVMVVSCIDTVDDGDTIAIDLASYGWGSMCGIIGFAHSTENSIVIQEQPTTTMSGSTLTITVGGATDNLTRHYLIFLGPTKNK